MLFNIYTIYTYRGSVSKIQGVSGNEFNANFVIQYQTSLLVISASNYIL
jgi:hypothetical protein